MIYTVTLNPSIDYIVQIDQLTIGDVNRMKGDLKLPGGKGINVSRILKRINTDSTALGFLGGFTGSFINNWLEREDIKTNFTSVEDDTRINIKLKASEETEINGQGPIVTANEMGTLKEALGHLATDDIVVLSGSKPASVPTGFYQELIEIIKAQGASFVIDTTGADLMDALEKGPLLVKPNNHELADLYQTTFNSIEDIYPFGQRLLDEGAQHALVSMAGDGALLFTQEGVYRSNVLKHQVKNSVGAGDSMIAGFVGSFTKTQDPVEAFKWGVACGSATTFSDDLATADFIQELLPEVKITKVK
ncbi:1-phosphofructokinase [Candidatus Enterococcus murrayae]|uniref:Tagatose-6-phosphate kinase n=1 Tax=Candidatus Enterococcus murrayae TaxID=2815321 RepID=A0ABS3HNA3_9ENTE|nr:1-phosphofructokinase [Enterococcus sp. MJM16]MBO0454942.1 1-phosphofructokinase [Enterococcus sp. MJM16]